MQPLSLQASTIKINFSIGGMKMKIAYFDCFSGVSGDMLLGAFIDLGLPLKQLESGLSSLGLGEEFSLNASRVEMCGIYGTKLNVITSENNIEPDYKGYHHNNHRHLGDIVDMISQSSLDVWVKDKSIEVFHKIAMAEGKVHNQPYERVHFHEVGAVDSIVDVVGTVLSVRLLEIGSIYCSPLPMSRGFVKTCHGILPLPAPATAELMIKIPVYCTDSEKELITPTGVALLSSLTQEFGYFPPSSRWERIGYGCGSHIRKIPNMLRIFTGWA